MRLAGAKAFAANPDECRHSVRISHGACRVEIWRGNAKPFRFQIPLIKPDMRFSRIRLSDKVVYAFAHGRLVLKRSSRIRPSSW